MNGSILFNPDINIEVDVDPSAEEGARLVSAKNLVDGQELGIGGGSDLPEVTSADAGKVLAVNASGEWAAEQKFVVIESIELTLNKTWNEIKTLLTNGIACYIHIVDEEEDFYGMECVTSAYFADGAYYVTAAGTNTDVPIMLFETDSANGYPYND